MSPPRLPAVTHLQVLVLEALSDAEQAGRELRTVLAAHRVRRSAPAFYQMMARLEDAAFVEGWYEQQVVAGQHLKERRYRITPRGRRALEEARAFYRELLGESRPARKGAHA